MGLCGPVSPPFWARLLEIVGYLGWMLVYQRDTPVNILDPMNDPTPRTEMIVQNEQGYSFMAIRELTPGQPRRYDSPAAVVHCERGKIAVIDEKLMHFVDGRRDHYDAAWLVEHASKPPEGLRIDPMPGHEWVARKLDGSSNWVDLVGLPRLIATGETRAECIDAAKRALGISYYEGELPSDVRIEHAGEVDDDTLFGEWVARRGHLQKCLSCHRQQQEAEVGMAAKWGYHLDSPTDLAVLHCQYCSKESKLTMNWRDEAGWP